MQPNEITLDVNHDNDDGTTATQQIIYTRFDEYQNRSEYISDAHVIALRDKVALYRTFPKATGNFAGTAKSAVKFTRDYEVPGNDVETTIIVPGIINIGFSLPVGVSGEDSLGFRMLAATMLLNDDIMIPLTDQLMV